MFLTSKCRLAIQALVELASTNEALTTPELAERCQGSTRFMESALRDLLRAGLIFSRRGRSGGYRLTRPASETSIADVVRFVDGPLRPSLCAEDASVSCDWCPVTCNLKLVMRQINAATSQILTSWTVADLIAADSTQQPANGNHPLLIP